MIYDHIKMILLNFKIQLSTLTGITAEYLRMKTKGPAVSEL